jgi:hypothetical protein
MPQTEDLLLSLELEFVDVERWIQLFGGVFGKSQARVQQISTANPWRNPNELHS